MRLPITFQSLLNVRLGPATGLAQRFGKTAQLRGGGDVRDEHAARRDHAIRLFKTVPRVKHVKHDAVEGVFRQTSRDRIEIAGPQIPPCGTFAKVNRRVGFGDAREFRTHLDGGEASALPHGIQQIDAHRARTGSGFQHVHTGTNITELNDLRDVLRIHDLRATRHGQHIVGQARTHDGELPTTDGTRSLPRLVRVAFRMRLVDLSLTFRTHRHDNGSFRLANHIIMQDDAMRGLRHTTRHQLIGDFIRPAVRELHFFTGGKRPSTHGLRSFVRSFSMRFHDYGLRLQTAFHGQQRTYATVSAVIPADGTKRRQCDGDVNITPRTRSNDHSHA